MVSLRKKKTMYAWMGCCFRRPSLGMDGKRLTYCSRGEQAIRDDNWNCGQMRQHECDVETARWQEYDVWLDCQQLFFCTCIETGHRRGRGSWDWADCEDAEERLLKQACKMAGVSIWLLKQNASTTGKMAKTHRSRGEQAIRDDNWNCGWMRQHECDVGTARWQEYDVWLDCQQLFFCTCIETVFCTCIETGHRRARDSWDWADCEMPKSAD